MAVRVHMLALFLFFIPALVLLPQRFDLESVYPRQFLADEKNILFGCERHTLRCVIGVFPVACMLIACAAIKLRFCLRCTRRTYEYRR